MRPVRLLTAAACLSLGCGAPDAPSPAKEPTPILQPITHGLAVAEMRPGRAIFWARGARDGTLHVRIGERHASAPLEAERDHTVRLPIDSLPAGPLAYRAWLTAAEGASVPKAEAMVAGAVRLPPADDVAAPVRFVWSGDLSGQNVCRDAERGFPAVQAMMAREADFAIALGDMIYADNPCEATGRFGNAQVPRDQGLARARPEYWAHWRYNLAAPEVQRMRRAFYAVWDDHEVVNDVGPLHDTRDRPPYAPGEHLLPVAQQAVRDYQPFAHDERLYRRARWGRHLELFFLDTRSYRDANGAPDDGEAPKTMLGDAQRRWLLDGLRASDATWKVIVSSVPMAIPTGWPPDQGRDGWCDAGGETGFERELLDILEAMRDASVRSLWITTDVHFATAFSHRPFAGDGGPPFEALEVVVGPLSAGLFPNGEVDGSLGSERLFFHGPEGLDAVTDYEEAIGWFNFGEVAIDEAGALTVAVRDGRGDPIWERRFEP
ncbi:MAG TPA: alkaline phosphatase D family protein [Sandaracinaceae bacterium LLY-WYZ-13_1]|nr:alkaline phosphatase D family protein [Sandaracinaceae bacterium LLY-WYZ-13_1]